MVVLVDLLDFTITVLVYELESVGLLRLPASLERQQRGCARRGVRHRGVQRGQPILLCVKLVKHLEVPGKGELRLLILQNFEALRGRLHTRLARRVQGHHLQCVSQLLGCTQLRVVYLFTWGSYLCR